MQHWAKTLTFATSGRGTYDVTSRVQSVVRSSGIVQGLCNLFIHHTSASLIICENADPAVRDDLERWIARAVPDGDPLFEHTAEGECMSVKAMPPAANGEPAPLETVGTYMAGAARETPVVEE